MDTTKVLVIGSSSLVGSHFVESFANKYEISAIGRKNIFEGAGLLSSFSRVDLRNEIVLREAINSSDAEFVINYASETNVDECESEKDNTDGAVYTTNCLAVERIATICKERRKKFYQISTDFVFDGSNGPYSEEDQSGPIHYAISWYGYTKYVAEIRLRHVAPMGYCIIRTSYPYRAFFDRKSDFARNLIYLFQRDKLYPMFTDQIFSPTLVDDISSAVDFLLSKNAEGTYHVACKNPTTPYRFATKLISKFFSVEGGASVKKSSITQIEANGGRAPRPIKGGLRTDRIQALGYVPRTYEEGVGRLFEQLTHHPNPGR